MKDFGDRIVTKNIPFILYFLICFALQYYFTDPFGLPSYNIRILFFIICFIPFLNKHDYLVFNIVSFLGVSLASFSPLLPTSAYFYVVPLTISIMLFKSYRLEITNKYFFFVFAYFTIINLIHFASDYEFFLWILIALAIILLVNDKSSLDNLSFAFMVSSIGICLLYIFFSKYFLVKIASDAEGGYERSQWLNPNQFAGMINCGGILASAYLTDFIKRPKGIFNTIIPVVSIILVFVVGVINSSRGGVSIFSLISCIMLLKSKLKKKYKILIVLLILCALYLVYSNGLMETLLYRMSDGGLSSGGSRTNIWESKLNLFIRSASFADLVFGIGTENCFKIGNVSTHNDFITAYISYGFIGLVLFCFLYIFPINFVKKRRRFQYIVFMSFLILESFSLEFFFRGYFILILFYLYVVKLLTYEEYYEQ